MRTFIVTVSVLFTVALTITLTPAARGEVLKILYENRPPYYEINDDGSVGGIISGRIDSTFRKAGIAIDWIHQPWNRQIATIKRNVDLACSPGWFKNPEREAFAKFSSPVYQDRPQVIVLRKKDAGRINHPTLVALLGDQNFKLGTKAGFSYGLYIDTLIKTQTPKMERTQADVDGMFRMLRAGRFDYFISAPEEFAALSERMGEAGKEITSTELPDFPPGNRRYLMCSKSVDDDTIQRFNAALPETPAD